MNTKNLDTKTGLFKSAKIMTISYILSKKDSLYSERIFASLTGVNTKRDEDRSPFLGKGFFVLNTFRQRAGDKRILARGAVVGIRKHMEGAYRVDSLI